MSAYPNNSGGYGENNQSNQHSNNIPPNSNNQSSHPNNTPPHLQSSPHPHHPHHLPQPHANNIQVPSPVVGHHPDPLSAHTNHGLPIAHPSYHYDQHAPQQIQLQSNHNGYANGNGHGGHHIVENGQMQQAPPVQPATPTNGDIQQKGNRLRKACDSCSIRKVKCDESGPPCRACAALEIPCTFDRPSRRRGPPNKHAEAIKKRKLEESPSGDIGGYRNPVSPNPVADTLVSLSYAQLNAESICPFEVVELLVEDFFTYIHPLCPFPHEPSFRAAFKDREDVRNPSFLSLLASMIGVLVASFPRKPIQHLKKCRQEHLFPNSVSFVDRCHRIAIEARGPGHLDKELSIYTAITSYFLGLAGAYTFRWRQTRLYFGETLTIIRVLGVHKMKGVGSLSIGALPTMFGSGPTTDEIHVQTFDVIQQELGLRMFWVMFVGIGSIQQLGSSFGELLMPPPTKNDPYPPFPAEVDDEYILTNEIGEQPAGVVSKIKGFNYNIKVYMSTLELSRMELSFGIDQVFDWDKQKKVLNECLRLCKVALEGAPVELLLQKGSAPGAFGNSSYFPQPTQYPGLGTNGEQSSEWSAIDPKLTRRQLQYEIQKANIYASQLGTRSYIVEKYSSLQEVYEQTVANAAQAQMSSPDVMVRGLDGMLSKTATSSPDTNVLDERDNIVKDLLGVLSSISQVNMEPNGGSFINKIRQIASTLISTPQSRKGPTAVKAEQYLSQFLQVLCKLERTSPGYEGNGVNGVVDGVMDEEAELNTWADLRDYQMKFAQAGGFLSEL